MKESTKKQLTKRKDVRQFDPNNIPSDLLTLKNIVEDKTRISMSLNNRTNETVFARALYFGIANELFNYSQTYLAESINRKRLNVWHAINNLYPYLHKFKPIYASLKNDIINEIDNQLGTKYAESYVSNRFSDLIAELNDMPEQSIDYIREKMLLIIRVEKNKLKNENRNNQTE